LAAQRERLPDAAAAGADHERAAGRRHVADVDGFELAGLVVDDVGRRGHVVTLLPRTEKRPALRTIVCAFGDDEAAFRTMASHDRAPLAVGRLGLVAAGPAREDVRETLDVGAGDDVLPTFVLLAQPVDQLGAQDVDLPVEDATP